MKEKEGGFRAQQKLSHKARFSQSSFTQLVWDAEPGLSKDLPLVPLPSVTGQTVPTKNRKQMFGANRQRGSQQGDNLAVGIGLNTASPTGH